MRWVYALWRVVSGRGRRILRPTFGEPVSAHWLRQQIYRAGQTGIDGPVWPWPLTKTTRDPTAGPSRSSHHVGRSDDDCTS